MSDKTDADVPRIAKTSRKELKNLSPCWRGSDKTSPSQLMAKTKRRSGDAQNCLGAFADLPEYHLLPTPFSAHWKRSRRDREHCWGSALEFGSWIKGRIPKKWPDSSNDFERLLPNIK